MNTVIIVTALATIALLTTVVVLRRRFAIVNVHGDSMSPAFAPGDRLLVRRTRLAAVRQGDVVVIASPDARPDMDPADRWHIKRVAALPGDPIPPGIPVTEPVVPARRLVLLGDNSRRSADSRTTGFYRADALMGIVLRRTASGSPDLRTDHDNLLERHDRADREQA